MKSLGESRVSIVDSDQNAGWEKVRQHGSGSPVLAGNLHPPPQPIASQQSDGNPRPATDPTAGKPVSTGEPENHLETDSNRVSDAGLGEQPRSAGNAVDRKRELSIFRRLVEKRRASERGKFKIRVLYVVGYLTAGIVLSWLIWQT